MLKRRQRNVKQSQFNRGVTAHRVISPVTGRPTYAYQQTNQSVRRAVIRRPSVNRRNSLVSSPRRAVRQTTNLILKSIAPKLYTKVHNCKREWSKLLSWRSSQSSGGSKKLRSKREMRASKSNFNKRDC